MCFTGNCIVELANGSNKPVSCVRKGDRVLLNKHSNSFGIVRCVLVTHIRSKYKFELINFSRGLLITARHPIYDSKNGKWIFPVDYDYQCSVKAGDIEYLANNGTIRIIGKPEDYHDGAGGDPFNMVYNFLLYRPTDGTKDSPDKHTMVVNGIVCTTFGCGITERSKREGSFDDTDVRGHPFLGDYAKVVDAMKDINPLGFEVGRVDCAGVVRDETRADRAACGFRKFGVWYNGRSRVGDRCGRDGLTEGKEGDLWAGESSDDNEEGMDGYHEEEMEIDETEEYDQEVAVIEETSDEEIEPLSDEDCFGILD